MDASWKADRKRANGPVFIAFRAPDDQQPMRCRYGKMGISCCDRIEKTQVLVSSALLLHVNSLQTDVRESVVSCLLESFRGEKKKRRYSPRTASYC
ncbi:hypothetical protein PAMP_008483 [Pampus punctatissimus]